MAEYAALKVNLNKCIINECYDQRQLVAMSFVSVLLV